MKYLINYADIKYFNSQKNNTLSGYKYGKFNAVINYGRTDIDTNFCKENNKILNAHRGAGYWLWKPYIILKALNSIQNDDYAFYSDSGCDFISSIDPLITLLEKNNLPLLIFHLNSPLLSEKNIEEMQTKKDTFVLMDCDIPEIVKSFPPRLACYILFKNCDFSKQFVTSWLTYAKDERILTDLPNTTGSNYPEYVAHRHDQSILSVLSKKLKLPSFSDPSQFGNNHREANRMFNGADYGQIINHHRSPK